jgi:DNA-3-methyladenine glycosylase II
MNYSTAVNFLQQSDPVLAQVIAQVGPCQLDKVQQEGDLFSSLARAIIHQQLSTKAATAIHQRFLQLYPDKPFPIATDILDTPEAMLRQVGISQPKCRYLKDLAQKVLAGLPTIEDLEQLDDESIITALTQVKGIGRWTVQMLLIFRLQRHDVLPVDDLGVRAGIRKVYLLKELPNKQQILSLGQKWQPYRSIASWYLWQSLTLS